MTEREQLEEGIAALGDVVVDTALAALCARLARLAVPELHLRTVRGLFMDVVDSQEPWAETCRRRQCRAEVSSPARRRVDTGSGRMDRGHGARVRRPPGQRVGHSEQSRGSRLDPGYGAP